MSKGVESYLHRYAKQTVASWLRGGVRVGENFKGLQPLFKSVPLGMPQPMYGVYEEFPIAAKTAVGLRRCCIGEAAEACQCLTGWHCHVKSNSKLTVAHRHGIPTIKELVNAKVPIEFIFDVGVVDTLGSLCCVVEVCHTNPMNPSKIKWLTDNRIAWCEVSAEWIMNQVRSPFSLTEGIVRSSSQDCVQTTQN